MANRPNPVQRVATKLRKRNAHPALERQIASPPRWMYPWNLGRGLEVPLMSDDLPHVHATRTAMLEDQVREAIQVAGPDCRVIDLATNEGWYSHKVLEWGAREVIAIDIRPQNVRRAQLVRDHLGISEAQMDVREGDVYELDTEALGKFDICLCLGLIYHIEHPVGLVRICRELTKPGGLCVIETQLTRQDQHIDWYLGPLRFKSPGSYALFAERDSAGNPVASAEGILSFIPNRAAIEETGAIAGFGDVTWSEPPADAENRFLIGDRGVAMLR